MPEWNQDDPVAVEAWQDISERYAEGASKKSER